MLTSMLTTGIDPQRGEFLHPEYSTMRPLVTSLQRRPLVVFADRALNYEHPDEPADNVEFVDVPRGGNPYRERWRHARDWLRQQRDLTYVWCVDATDVLMLHDPFPHMVDGVLYVGSEQAHVGDSWLHENHPGARTFAAGHKRLPLLNGGLVGGDAVTVAGFLACLVDHLDQPRHAEDMTDMGAFNELAWTWFAPRVVTGPKVHTVFRAQDHSNTYAWWSHK